MRRKLATLALSAALATGLLTAPTASAAVAGCDISQATGATRTAQYVPTGINGSDTSSDRTGIQSAIDRASASGGGVVPLPAGTFYLSRGLVLKPGVKLVGAGTTTVLKANSTFLSTAGPRGGYPLVTTNGADNVTIAALTADHSGNTLNGNIPGRLTEYMIDLRASTNAVVDNVHTRNPFTYSIVAADSDRFCIKASSTRSSTQGRYDQLDGIHILNSHTGDVIGNTVDQGAGGATGDGDDGLVAHTINGTVHDVAYIGNTVRGGRHGAGMQLAWTASTDRIYNLLIQGNTFWGSPHEGIHTGTYGTPGSANHITIGGAAGKGNVFRDNAGPSVDLSGRVTYATVTHNTVCRSGPIIVPTATGNVVASNATAC